MEVREKVAIVTGASSGIGQATARLLWTRGVKLALAARSLDKLEQTAMELPGSVAIPTDVSNPEQVRRMVEASMAHFGRIDILVNSAGQGYDATLEETDAGELRHILDLDVIGPIAAMQQVIPLMRKQGAGSIVNISSGLALRVIPGMGGYGGLKRALSHISLTARLELAGDNISVSVVYPYITLSDFEKNTVKPMTRRESASEEGGVQPGPPFPADPPELVAQKILEAIESGAAEVFAHDWMGRAAGTS